MIDMRGEKSEANINGTLVDKLPFIEPSQASTERGVTTFKVLEKIHIRGESNHKQTARQT